MGGRSEGCIFMGTALLSGKCAGSLKLEFEIMPKKLSNLNWDFQTRYSAQTQRHNRISVSIGHLGI